MTTDLPRSRLVGRLGPSARTRGRYQGNIPLVAEHLCTMPARCLPCGHRGGPPTTARAEGQISPKIKAEKRRVTKGKISRRPSKLNPLPGATS